MMMPVFIVALIAIWTYHEGTKSTNGHEEKMKRRDRIKRGARARRPCHGRLARAPHSTPRGVIHQKTLRGPSRSSCLRGEIDSQVGSLAETHPFRSVNVASSSISFPSRCTFSFTLSPGFPFIRYVIRS